MIRNAIWILMIFALLPVVYAEDVVINSKAWQDVYSGVQYAKLTGGDADFVTSERNAIELPSRLAPGKSYLVLQGRQNFASGYANLLIGRGLQASTLSYDTSINIALAERLREDGVRSYIIVDDRKGYNAMSVAAYAIASRSFVLFANIVTIEDIVDFLEQNPADSIMVYGHIGREETDAITPFAPETVNIGNRFANNIEIVDRYLRINPTNQTILANGEFIEDELMTGLNPVLFIGQDNVPDETKEFMVRKGFTHAVLIGNNLIPTGSFVKNQLDIPVFVKFAVGVVTGGTSPELSDLSIFEVPRHVLAIGIDRVAYNVLAKQLEVRYRNLVESPSYFKATIKLEDSTIGDDEAIFIDSFQEKTVIYDLELPEDIATRGPLAQLLVLYGDSPGSLEFLLEKNVSVSTVRILDSSDMRPLSMLYDVRRRSFILTVENFGEADAYVSGELIDLLVDGERISVSSDSPVLIKAGETVEIRIRQIMTDFDLDDNPQVDVRLYFGERQGSLFKFRDETMPLEIRSLLNLTNIAIAVGVILLILLIIFFWRRRKKKK